MYKIISIIVIALTNILSISNSKINLVNNYNNEAVFDIFYYGKLGYNSFENYVENNEYYCDPSYYLLGQIGTDEKWNEEGNRLSNPIETYLLEDELDEWNPVIILNWKSGERQTSLLVKEMLSDDEENKSLDICWNIIALNMNRIEHVKFQAYL